MFNEIIIYKDNLINNIKQVKTANQNSKICAMVKANAYGVGMKEVVEILENYVDFWGVACFFEAQIISNITKKKILIVGALEKESVDESFSYSCGDVDDVQSLIKLNKKINIHLKINSGMNRYGFTDIKEFKKAMDLISKSKLNVEGIYTHFATVDGFTEKQMDIFNKFVKVCKRFGFNPIVHADNSFVNEKYNHHLDMVRIGFNLFNQSKGWFLPAVKIKSKFVKVQEVKKGELIGYDYRCVAQKNMKVAIIPVGYADGFDLKYVGLDLNIDGKLCKILNICMDCFMLNITNLDIKKGDELFLIDEFNPLSVYSNYLETNEYEILTKFSQMRVIRVIV